MTDFAPLVKLFLFLLTLFPIQLYHLYNMPRPITRSMVRAGAASLTKVGGSTACESIKSESTTSDHLVSDGLPVSKDLGWNSVVVAGPRFDDDVLTKNRMLILQLEQRGVLAPGVVTIASSGELQANLSVAPDSGTINGLFPNMAPSHSIDEQLPSWIRDYLIKELNVLGRGPPVACQALYDGLQRSQDGVGVNVSVWFAEMQLSCAVISLEHSIDVLQDFVHSNNIVQDTYDMEVDTVIKTIKHLVSCEGDEFLHRDIQLLVDIGRMGSAMKEAINEPLERMIIAPYSLLVPKLGMVANALRQDLGRMRQEKEDAMSDDCSASRVSPDSGVDFY